jgi:hypothetical protein
MFGAAACVGAMRCCYVRLCEGDVVWMGTEGETRVMRPADGVELSPLTQTISQQELVCVRERHCR